MTQYRRRKAEVSVNRRSRLGRSRAHFLVIAACLCFIYVTGIANLKSDPITHYSEWNSLRHVGLTTHEPLNSFPEIVASIQKKSSDHGPLYFFLMRVWGEFVGSDLLTYRLLSVYFGLFGLVFAYRLVLITGDSDTALDAAVITAFLAFLMFFTHEARMYSLLASLSAFVAWMYWRVVSQAREARWWQWLALTLGSAAIIYTHYFGIMLLAGLGLYHLCMASKNRQWFGVCVAMVAAGFLFLPWLPVVQRALRIRGQWDLTVYSLSLIESVLALAGIYSNGLFPIVIVVVAAVILRFKRLDSSRKYILFLAAAIPLLMLLANEILPLLIARRIRYTIVMAIPWACAAAIGLNLLPRWGLLRLPFTIVWIASFFLYSASDDFSLYNNAKTQNFKEVAHYEDFIYQTNWSPSPDEAILSFHPSEPLYDRVLSYYSAHLYQWMDLIHFSYDEAGELLIQSGADLILTPKEMAREIDAAWVLHNPQRVDLLALEIYTDWFLRHYQPCKRYLDAEDSVIEYFVSKRITCEQRADVRLMAIKYDNGTEIGDVAHEIDADKIHIGIWLTRVVQEVYSLSLQILAQDGTKAEPQLDAVITARGLQTVTLDISSLPKSDYGLHLIVYDRQTLQSQPGSFVYGGERFERSIEVARFSIDE